MTNFRTNVRIVEVEGGVGEHLMPLQFVHHQIAYEKGYFGKGIIDGREYDFSDTHSNAYSVNNKGAVIQAIPKENGPNGGGPYSMSVYYDGKTFGPYTKVFPPIVSVAGKPTYFASLDGRSVGLYQSGSLISPSSAGVPPRLVTSSRMSMRFDPTLVVIDALSRKRL